MCNSAHFWPVALKSRGRWRRSAAGSTRAVFTHVCYIGVQSAVKGLIEKHGFKYELTSRFNQDAIENFLLLLNRELKDTVDTET